MIRPILISILRVAAVLVALGFLIGYTLYASGRLRLFAAKPVPAAKPVLSKPRAVVLPSSKVISLPVFSVRGAEGGGVIVPAVSPTAAPLVVLPSSKSFVAQPLAPRQPDVSLDQPLEITRPGPLPSPPPVAPAVFSGSKSGIIHPLRDSSGTIQIVKPPASPAPEH